MTTQTQSKNKDEDKTKLGYDFGDYALKTGYAIGDLTTTTIDVLLDQKLKLGAVKLVFTGPLKAVGAIQEFYVSYNEAYEKNGGDKYKAVAVSGVNTGVSLGFSALSGLFATSVIAGAGGVAVVGTAGAILIPVVVGVGGSIVYDVLVQMVKNALEETDDITILLPQESVAVQLQQGQLIVNGNASIDSGELNESAFELNDMLIMPDIEFENITINQVSEKNVVVYTIKKGDTLSEIAVRFGTTTEILLALNTDIDKDNKTIYADNKLNLPEGSKEIVVEKSETYLKLSEANADAISGEFGEKIGVDKDDLHVSGSGATYINEDASVETLDGKLQRVVDLLSFDTDAPQNLNYLSTVTGGEDGYIYELTSEGLKEIAGDAKFDSEIGTYQLGTKTVETFTNRDFSTTLKIKDGSDIFEINNFKNGDYGLTFQEAEFKDLNAIFNSKVKDFENISANDFFKELPALPNNFSKEWNVKELSEDVDLEKLATLLDTNVKTIEESLTLKYEKASQNNLNWNLDIEKINGDVSELEEGTRQKILDEMSDINAHVNEKIGGIENTFLTDINQQFSMSLKDDIEYKYKEFAGDVTGVLDTLEDWKKSQEEEVNKQILYVKKNAEQRVKSFILEKAPFTIDDLKELPIVNQVENALEEINAKFDFFMKNIEQRAAIFKDFISNDDVKNFVADMVIKLLVDGELNEDDILQSLTDAAVDKAIEKGLEKISVKDSKGAVAIARAVVDLFKDISDGDFKDMNNEEIADNLLQRAVEVAVIYAATAIGTYFGGPVGGVVGSVVGAIVAGPAYIHNEDMIRNYQTTFTKKIDAIEDLDPVAYLNVSKEFLENYVQISLDFVNNVADAVGSLVGWDNAEKPPEASGSELKDDGSGAKRLYVINENSNILYAREGWADDLYGVAKKNISDRLIGSNQQNQIFGQGGDDFLDGRGGDDVIVGGYGHDIILAGSGNDMILGDKNDNNNHGNDDLIFAGTGDDTVSAAGGSDDVFGMDGNDAILGGGGNDALFGDNGEDTLNGDAGDDELLGGNDNDELNGNTGDDILLGGEGNDLLIGSSGDDVLKGQQGNDVLYGGIGNDELVGGQGNDTLVAGDGDDILVGGDGTNLLEGGAGNDRFIINSDVNSSNYITDFNIDEDQIQVVVDSHDVELKFMQASNGTSISFSDGRTLFLEGVMASELKKDNIQLSSNGQIFFQESVSSTERFYQYLTQNQSVLDQFTPDDTAQYDNVKYWHKTIYKKIKVAGVTIGRKIDRYDLKIENDMKDINGDNTFLGSNHNNHIDTGNGDDVIYGVGGRNTLYAGNDNDMVFGASLEDKIYGQNGDDLLFGRGGNDFIDGGSGNDLIDGDSGNDTIIGGTGNDFINGDDGNDHIEATSGMDYVDGGAGDDVISVNEEMKDISGGKGKDTLDFTQSKSAINMNLGSQVVSIVNGKSYSARSIESLVGSAFDDTLAGSFGSDTINGGDGNDRLSTGVTRKYAQDNTEEIDSLIGGSGVDYFEINDGKQSKSVITIEDFDVKSGEVINLDDFGDGKYYRDLKITQVATDVHIAVSDNKKLILKFVNAADLTYKNFEINATEWTGGLSHDTLVGSHYDDKLIGGAGDDTLIARKGNDILSGNSGNDTFVFDAQKDGVDVITDYQVGEMLDLNDAGVIHLDQLNISQQGKNTVIEWFDNQRIVLENFKQEDLRSENIVLDTFSNARTFEDTADKDIILQSDFTDGKFSESNWADRQGGHWSSQKFVAGDFDGNGKDDIAKIFNNGGATNINVHLSDGNQFNYQGWANRQGGHWDSQKFVAGDFDGDGKDDIAKIFNNGGQTNINVHLSNGKQFTKQSWAGRQGGHWDSQRYITGDFNGDGKDDIAKIFDNEGETNINVHLSNGKQFTYQGWADKQGGHWDSQKFVSGDFDGDGKDDIAKIFNNNGETNINMHLSNGEQFTTYLSWADKQGGHWNSQRFISGDFNGDGRDDIAKVFNNNGETNINAHLSLGNSFKYEGWANQQGGHWNSQRFLVGDFDGDGFFDVSKIYNNGRQTNINIHKSLDGSNLIKGDDSENYLMGQKGDDQLFGKSGNDELFGGVGNDAVYGGTGNDTINGNDGMDLLFGENGNDIISGGNDNDELQGGSGDDTLDGGDGNDLLQGGAGNDDLHGNAGHDILIDGAGSDRLTGGDGSDIFIISNEAESKDVDTITDFELGQDKIDFRAFEAVSGFDELNVAQDGKNAVINLTNGHRVVLENVDLSFAVVDPAALGESYTKVVSSPGFNAKYGGWTTQEQYPRHMADVNGDGTDDIVGFGEKGVFYSLSNGDGTFGKKTQATHLFGASSGWRSQDKYPRFMADLNDDGYADIVAFGQAGVYTALNDQNGSFEDKKLAVDSFNYTRGWVSQDRYPVKLADVNGDGFSDIIAFASSRVYTALGRGDGTFEDRKEALLDTMTSKNGWQSQNKYPREVADVNGDGYADIVGFGKSHVYTSLGKGDGTFEDKIEATTEFSFSEVSNVNEKVPRNLIDMNGDGRADIVGFYANGTRIAYANEDGTFAASEAGIKYFGVNSGWYSQNVSVRQLADVNGDGLGDSVGFGTHKVVVAFDNEALRAEAEVQEIKFSDNFIFGNIKGTAENDTITITSPTVFNFNSAYGLGGNDSLVGSQLSDKLFGDAGNDTLTGGSGQDILIGGTGLDRLTGGAGEDIFIITKNTENPDIDIITDFEVGKDKIDLSAFNNVGRFVQLHLDQHGNDTVISLTNGQYVVLENVDKATLSNDDFKLAELDSDALRESDTKVHSTQRYNANEDDDWISGGSNDDTLYGKTGNDAVFGNAGNDTLYGHEGDDFLSGGDGDDYIRGRQDNDTIYGGAGNDQLFGDTQDSGDDEIHGELGNDSLYGGGGNDTLNGGSGDDFIYAHSGNDLIYGGDGDDYIRGRQDNDTIYGGAGNDRLFGDAQDNGDDQIYGETGNDTLYGGGGNDTLSGGRDNDSIYGHAGDDFLSGGAGADVLIGGSGADYFVFEAFSDSEKNNTDIIMDFKQTADKIDLSNTGINALSEFDITYLGSGTNTVTLLMHQDEDMAFRMRGEFELIEDDFVF